MAELGFSILLTTRVILGVINDEVIVIVEPLEMLLSKVGPIDTV